MSTKKEYQKAFDGWVACQKNVIKQIELNIQNSKNMIEVHTEALALQLDGLKDEKELLEKAIAVNEEEE